MEKVENMGIVKLVEELRKLNPHTCIQFTVIRYPGFIITNHPFKFFQLRMMKLPEGYYFSDKNTITNKGNTATGKYECFDLVTEREFRKAAIN